MKKRSLLQRLLSNNQVLFVLSVIISLGIWVYMSTGSSNDTVVTVEQVPIQVVLPDEASSSGMTTYFTNQESAYASVTVTGNRKLLGSITKDDFIVTANASNVDRVGTFELSVSADKKSSINSSFQITNCTPAKVTVKVDTESKKDFKIVPKFKYGAKDDYYAYVTYDNDTITITGPSEEVRAISKVGAVTSDMENLDASKDFTANIVLYDENDKELSQNYLTLSAKTVKGTVNISPQKTVPVKTVFVNKPKDLNVSEILTVDPEQVSIAGTEEDLKRVYSVSLDEIDFSTLKNEKRHFDSLQPKIPEGCKIIDNNSVFKVTLDLSGFSSKTLTIEQFKLKNLPDGYKGEVTTKNLKVTFYGPKADLEKLTAAKVTAIVDASESNGSAVAQDLPVSFNLEDNTTCWAYGAHLASVVTEEK